MRIGITCRPTQGGSGTVATELDHELARQGHQVHSIISSLAYRLNVCGEDIFFHKVTLMASPLFEYPLCSPALAATMAEVVEGEELTVLHVHYALPHAVWAFLAEQMLGRITLKVVTTLHRTDITVVGNDTSFHSITTWSLGQSDRATAVSAYLRDKAIRRFCCEDETVVITTFVDTEEFHGEPISEEGGILLQMRRRSSPTSLTFVR